MGYKREEMAPATGRLYAKAVFTGYKRGQRNQHENTALLQIQGSANKEEARWYVGKRSAYVYKAKNKTSVPGQAEKSNLRCIWGKVTPSWQRRLCARQIRAQP